MTGDPSASAGFTDRVMADIAGETTPTPVRSFLAALGRRSARDATAVLWVAWHLGTVRRWRIASGVRARSIALVLAVICALGTGSLAAASALRVAVEPAGVFFLTGGDDHGDSEDDPAAAAPPRPVADDRSGQERLQDDPDVDEKAQPVPSIDGPTTVEARGDSPSGDDEDTEVDRPEPGQPDDDESSPHDEPSDAVDTDDDEPGDDDPDADDDPSGTDEPEPDDDRETDEPGDDETSASDEGDGEDDGEEHQPSD